MTQTHTPTRTKSTKTRTQAAKKHTTFRSQVKARPIFHHTKQAIQAHLAIVTAALAIAHRLEQASGLSIKRLIRTLKRYRTFTITLNGQTLHAANTPPTHITELLNHINQHIHERKI